MSEYLYKKKSGKKYQVKQISKQQKRETIQQFSSTDKNKKKVRFSNQAAKKFDGANVDQNVGIKSATGVYQSVEKIHDFKEIAKQLKKKKPTEQNKYAQSSDGKRKFTYETDKPLNKPTANTKKKNYTNKSYETKETNYNFNSRFGFSATQVKNRAWNDKTGKSRISSGSTGANRAGSTEASSGVATGNKGLENKGYSHIQQKSNMLGASVSKAVNYTVQQVDKLNSDQNVGIKGLSRSVDAASKTYQGGRNSFAYIKSAYMKRKVQQQVIKEMNKKVMATAAKQAAVKAGASVATASLPVITIIISSFLLFFIIVAVIAPTSYHHLSSYPGTDEEVAQTNQGLTSQAQAIKAKVVEVEDDPAYDHIDEFRYTPSKSIILDSFDYDPFVLMAYLSAKYQDYNMLDVMDEVNIILHLLFKLTFTEVTEVKYDNSGDPYDWYVLKINFVKGDLETIVKARMNADELKLYELYFEETADIKGNIHNPFKKDWYPFITCKMGWRYIQGKEDNHTGMDISWSNIFGTPIHAGLSGTVTRITYESDGGSYGNRVEISSADNGVTVLYAHMSDIYVNVGDSVMAGRSVLGTVGSTGWSTGAHLHIEVFKNATRLDPILVLSRFYE